MSKSRQPVSTAAYRNYGVAVPFDPIDGPLTPGGQIKFPTVPGAPTEGIVVQLPRSWGSHTRVLIFKLKLSKEGATEPTVSISSALYRDPRVETDDGEGHDDEVDAAEDAPVAPTVPATPVRDLMNDSPLLRPSPLHLAAEADESVAEGAQGSAAGEGAVGERGAATDHQQVKPTGSSGDDDDGERLPQWILDHATGANPSPPRPALQATQPTDEQTAARLEDADGAGGEDEGTPQPPPPPPSPPPPPPQPPPVVPRSSARHQKRKQHFGDNGEFEGPASRFRSAPPPRKASVDPSVEMGVPAYALPGERVWAKGLRAGVRMRFKAEVLKLRKQFPRIVVKYVATEDDETYRHVLPDVLTAYLHMGDVEKCDW